MAAAEAAVYNNAITQTDPKAKAAAIEAYLTQYPQTVVKAVTLAILMQTYAQANDVDKALDAADRLLQVDPNNLRGLFFEAFLRQQGANSLTDAAAKQAGLDAAAGYAQKGLAATKPADMTDADFKKVQDTAFPILYSIIAATALNKKDNATAIDAYKKELAYVPLAQTQDMTQSRGSCRTPTSWRSLTNCRLRPTSSTARSTQRGLRPSRRNPIRARSQRRRSTATRGTMAGMTATMRCWPRQRRT
jgi:tetratricopeptide (TPR) repeat protein